MKNLTAPERAVALVHEALDVLQRAEHVTDSPVNTFLPGKMRRKYRRAARRLRRHESQPRYRNLHSAEELAEIYERTSQRDEMIEQGLRDFQRITLALGRVLEAGAGERWPSGRTTPATAIASIGVRPHCRRSDSPVRPVLAWP
jgi:hypothetical protein